MEKGKQCLEIFAQDPVLCTITGGEVRPEIVMISSATILKLKERIEEQLGVEVGRQTLWFHHIKLRNFHTIEFYGIQHVALINLDVTPLPGQQKFSISVKSLTAEAHVRVKESNTVADLKLKIERLWGIPSNHITLIRLSKEMENDLPLSSYYICEGSQVEVSIALEPR